MRKRKREMPQQFRGVLCRLFMADGRLLAGGFLAAGLRLVTTADAVDGLAPGSVLRFEMPFLGTGRWTAVLQQVGEGMATFEPEFLPADAVPLAPTDFIPPAAGRDLICAAFTEAYPAGVHFSAVAEAAPADGALRILARSGINYAAQPLQGGVVWDIAAGQFCGMLRSRSGGLGWVTELVEIS